MPIVWKTSFEDPLITMHRVGKINLVDSITTLYDLTIKQGLPAAPGTPAGPLISGNTAAFKQALTTYFKITAIQRQGQMVKIYVSYLKSLLLKIKEIQKKIKQYVTRMTALLGKIALLKKKISQLLAADSIAEKKQAAIELVVLASTIAELQEVFVFIAKLKDKLVSFIKPKLKKLKDAIKKLVKKIIAPILQSSTLVMFKSLVTRIKELIRVFKEKKALFIKKINTLIRTVKDKIAVIRKFLGSIPIALAKQIASLVTALLKSTSLAAIINISAQILSIVDSNSKISSSIKLEIRNAVSFIIEIKDKILRMKAEFMAKLKQKFNEKKQQLIARFKPKTKGPNKIEEIKKDAKNVKELIIRLRPVIKKTILITLLLNEIRKESIKISKLDPTIKYESNSKLADLLNKTHPGSGDKYLTYTSINFIKAFLIVLLSEYINKLEVVKKAKQKIKDRVSRVKSSIAKKKINKQELIFNSYLRLAVTGYWTAGVMPNLGIVTFPGTLVLPISMKPTANPDNFIRSLSKALQLHTKTVAGTYTTATTPPVILPWIGYL